MQNSIHHIVRTVLQCVEFYVVTDLHYAEQSHMVAEPHPAAQFHAVARPHHAVPGAAAQTVSEMLTSLLMMKPAKTRMERIQRMKRRTPGFHFGALNPKVSSTPL